VILGINKITSSPKKVVENNNNQVREEPKPEKIDEIGTKVIKGIQVGQISFNGLGSIISSLSVAAKTIKNVFDPQYYSNMLNDPWSGTGYFGPQMIPSSIPYNMSINKGKDVNGDDIYWRRTTNNVMEVY
jgi:hypothetical protein